MKYPVAHDLDGVYFRMKRDNKYYDICFSDLTEEEKNNIMNGKTVEWLKTMCIILSNTIYNIGERFNIFYNTIEKNEKQ